VSEDKKETHELMKTKIPIKQINCAALLNNSVIAVDSSGDTLSSSSSFTSGSRDMDSFNVSFPGIRFHDVTAEQEQSRKRGLTLSFLIDSSLSKRTSPCMLWCMFLLFLLLSRRGRLNREYCPDVGGYSTVGGKATPRAKPL